MLNFCPYLLLLLLSRSMQFIGVSSLSLVVKSVSIAAWQQLDVIALTLPVQAVELRLIFGTVSLNCVLNNFRRSYLA